MNEVLEEAFRLFARGVADRRSPFHTPTAATTDEDGAPCMRTVVLRAWDAETRALTFHTDARSAKFAHLRARPEASLHVYDAARRIQVRVSGRTAIHQTDAVARAAWAAAAPGSRDTYRVTQAPGSAAPDPEAVDLLGGSDEAAYARFAAVRLFVRSLEWLHLASGGHRRARFTWPDGAARGEWLVP